MGPGRPPSTRTSGPPATASPTRRPSGAPDASGVPDGVAHLLGDHTVFRTVPWETLRAMADAARVERHATGELILDAFDEPGTEVFLVVSGQVDLWNDPARIREAADEKLGPGGLFGFSTVLTETSLGPRVVAACPTTVAAFPAAVVEPAFATPPGARFLAEQASLVRPASEPPVYLLVDDLIVTTPLVVRATDRADDVARAMSERDVPCAAITDATGRSGLITDAILRQRLIVDGLPGSTPAAEIMDGDVPVVLLGESAAEAQLLMFDRDAEFLLVTDRNGQVRGVVSPRDFAVSPASSGISLHEQMRRVTTVDDLRARAALVPRMLGDLLARGLAPGKVIAVYSAVLDTVVRRALVLTFADFPDLSLDAFTWLSLGSNGRREATLGSDIDSAATFDDAVDQAGIARYRTAFAQVDALLAECGLLGDQHGATASHPSFARTGAAWRAAAAEWMGAPAKEQGAIMASLLVDGRPIHGDPGLPAAAEVFQHLRRHPATMRLLLHETLSHRARLRSFRGGFTWPEEFDLKAHALLPIVNIARWAALAAGSSALPTVERLRVAGGSTMLPDEQAQTLIEVFEVLQRLRLRHQIAQFERGAAPSDVLVRDLMSPIDRSVVAQAVREIAAVQRRMDQVSAYLAPKEWPLPPAPGSV